MINNGTSQYADAFFEINYVKAYSLGTALDPIVSGTSVVLSSVSPTATSGASASGTSSGSGTNGALPSLGGRSPYTMVLGMLAAVVLVLCSA